MPPPHSVFVPFIQKVSNSATFLTLTGCVKRVHDVELWSSNFLALHIDYIPSPIQASCLRKPATLCWHLVCAYESVVQTMTFSLRHNVVQGLWAASLPTKRQHLSFITLSVKTQTPYGNWKGISVYCIVSVMLCLLSMSETFPPLRTGNLSVKTF